MLIKPVQMQARRVIIPSARIMEYLTRKNPDEFVLPRLMELHSDVRTGRIMLHINSATVFRDARTGKPAPFNHTEDWNEVFGVIPCAASGKPTPVERITVSGEAYNALAERFRDFAEWVYKESCVAGSDSGNVAVADGARAVLNTMPPTVR